jgi:hypothetical protein
MDQKDPEYLKSRLDYLDRGRWPNCGQVTLASATQTTITGESGNSNLSSNSVIWLTADASSAATQADITSISTGKDTFTINHTSPGATTKVFSYAVFTGWRGPNEP